MCIRDRPNSPISRGNTASIRCTGNRSPITPVEATTTPAGRQASALAARVADHLTSCIPRSPVNALALPLFTSNARARPEVMLSRHQITGADAVLDRVKTPAAVVPCDKAASSRSLRRRYLIPAAATANRTPATSGMRGKRRGASGDLKTSGNCLPSQNACTCHNLPWQCLYFLPEPQGHSALGQPWVHHEQRAA